VRLRSGRLHVLLIDKGARPVRVTLALPTTAPATVQRLVAPSVRARYGVTLAGQQLGAAGQWVGTRVVQRVVPVARSYPVTVPPMSAALLSVPGRPYRHQ
jgi:hypothetical protein